MALRRAIFAAVGTLLLASCIGKVELSVERELRPTILAPSATLTETVRFRFEPPPGATAAPGLDGSVMRPNLPVGSGWTVTDTSQGAITETRVTRTLTGDRLFTVTDDPGLGVFAVRVTDLFVVRRYEVKIGIAGSPADRDRPSDPASAALAALLLGAISYDQVLVMPGTVTAHDFPQADGSRLTWRMDLADPKGRVLHAESLYLDPAAAAVSTVALLGLLAAGAVLARRRLIRRAR